MSLVSTICWNPLCRKSVAAHKAVCPSCGSPLDLTVDREQLRMVSEDSTSATPLRVVLAQSSYRSQYYLVKQCWAKESSQRDLARTLFPSAKRSASSLPRVEGLPVFAGQGESTFLTDSNQYLRVPFIVQDHVEGPTLREIGEGRNVLSEKRAAEVLQSLLIALVSLHHRGIVARLITPDTIKVDDLSGNGVFVHLDFAEIVECRALPDDVAGNIHLAVPREATNFAAPEISKGVCSYSSCFAPFGMGPTSKVRGYGGRERCLSWDLGLWEEEHGVRCRVMKRLQCFGSTS